MGLCGYNGGYMPEWGIDNLTVALPGIYPDFIQLINLESSREGRPIRAIKMGKGSSPTRRGVLFVGGIHPRELINPDALVYFAFNFAYAYNNNQAYVLGGKQYDAGLVKLIIENVDMFILPLANPDGRAYVLSPSGDRMWRGNRAPNPGLGCKGVDINRNFDFLWNSGIDTANHPCNTEKYKGPSAFSEPETRNVRKLLDDYPHIGGMIDVHSYSEAILYTWSDDENQSTTPAMNFQNPAYNGQRGKLGDAYREYIPQADWNWLMATGEAMRQGIAAVRGRNYAVQQSVWLYPTSATSDDYSYGRHLVNPTKRKVFAYTLETSPLVKKSNGDPDYLTSFQPPFPEAGCIMEDLQPALLEFSLRILSASSELIDGLNAAAATAGGGLKATKLSRTGRKFAKLLEENRDELLELARSDSRLWRQSLVTLKRVLPIIQSHDSARPRVIEEAMVQRIDDVLRRLGERGSAKLRRAMQSIRQDLEPFVGQTMVEGLRAADVSSPRKQK